MTVFSNDIKDFLDTIYFYEIAHNTYPIDNITPVHDFFLEKLSTIESFPTRKHKLSTTFPFSRDKMFGVIFGRYEFGYLFDGNIVYVYGYRRKGNRSNDWLDSIIKESIYITQSDICRIVESTVREYMNRQVLNENKNTCLSFVDTDGCKWDAVSSFQNGRGVGYIVEDDGCYLIYVKGKGGYWRSEYIFPEAYSALQRLPSPDTLD